MVKLVNELHNRNAFLPMDVTELGMVTLVSPVHSRNELSLIVVTELLMIRLFIPLQPENASLPIDVTELGIDTLVKLLQFLNAQSPMVMTELGKLILINWGQPLKALAPMEVTELPSFTLFSVREDCIKEVGILLTSSPTLTVEILVSSNGLIFNRLAQETALKLSVSREVQPENALEPMDVTEPPMVRVFRPLHSANALDAIVVTELGMSISLNWLQ